MTSTATRSRIAAWAGDDFRAPDGNFLVILVREGEKGFYPVSHAGWITLEQARQHASEINTDLGLTADEVREIRASSHFGHPITWTSLEETGSHSFDPAADRA